ncbi:MAG TPA: helix-turn-helix transcriptional regulator [Candidatus Pullichristensenella stercoripullorum]|nr:helix-turn-helix transcriptional regulator [Candidatus Pullichristensenella stercoripullorum]
MEPTRISRFIAERRKALGLTQRQLAEQLSVSDKAVSKWETGRGLPDVLLMPPLCAALGITVNDLLSGERVEEGDYRKKAEENMMELIRENAENRQRLLQSIACGGVTVVAVCALVALAAFLPLPAFARVALLLLAMATAVVGIWAAATLDARAGWFECPHCKELFAPAMADYVKGLHTFTRRRLTCPHCGQTGMCRHRVTR